MIPIVEKYKYQTKNIIGFAVYSKKGLEVTLKEPQVEQKIFEIFGNVTCDILEKEKIGCVWYIKKFIIVSWSKIND